MTKDQTAERFSRLIDAERRYVRGYLYTMIPSEADDLWSETCLRAWRAWPRYIDRNPRGWLLTIARNTVRDTFRRRQVIQILSLDALADQNNRSVSVQLQHLTRAHVDVYPSDYSSEYLETVYAALRAMPQRERLALAAVAGGQSMLQIAHLAGTSTGGAKTLLFRARDRLAAAVGRPRSRRHRTKTALTHRRNNATDQPSIPSPTARTLRSTGRGDHREQAADAGP